MPELLTDPTFLTVCIGTALIGATSGALGSFAYLRRQALIGDVVAHASLLGIMVAFILSDWMLGRGDKSFAWLIPGALLAGVAAMLLTRAITTNTRVKDDAALGVMLAIFFGGGVMLLSEGGHLAHLHLFGYVVEPMAKSTFYFVIAVLVIVDIVQSRYQKKLSAKRNALPAATAVSCAAEE